MDHQCDALFRLQDWFELVKVKWSHHCVKICTLWRQTLQATKVLKVQICRPVPTPMVISFIIMFHIIHCKVLLSISMHKRTSQAAMTSCHLSEHLNVDMVSSQSDHCHLVSTMSVPVLALLMHHLSCFCQYLCFSHEETCLFDSVRIIQGMQQAAKNLN